MINLNKPVIFALGALAGGVAAGATCFFLFRAQYNREVDSVESETEDRYFKKLKELNGFGKEFFGEDLWKDFISTSYDFISYNLEDELKWADLNEEMCTHEKASSGPQEALGAASEISRVAGYLGGEKGVTGHSEGKQRGSTGSQYGPVPPTVEYPDPDEVDEGDISEIAIEDENKILDEQGDAMEPYLIAEEEFNHPTIYENYDREDCVFYAGDDTLVDSTGDILNVPDTVSWQCLEEFDDNEGAPIYVRNEKLRMEFEILLNPYSYRVEVLGIDENGVSRKSRENKKKPKSGDWR